MAMPLAFLLDLLLIALCSLCGCCFSLPHAPPAPPPPPVVCANSRVPVVLGQPLSFCGFSGISCCDAIGDAVLREEFLAMMNRDSKKPNVSSNIVKAVLCERCAPIPLGWADGQSQKTAGAGNQQYGSLVPEVPPQAVLQPPTNNLSWIWILYMSPFAVYGIYQGWKKYLASCLGRSQTQPTPPPPPNNPWLCCWFSNICTNVICWCCSQVRDPEAASVEMGGRV